MIRLMGLLMLSTSLFLSGCATPIRTIAPKSQTIDVPGENVVSRAELGETILTKALVYEYDAIDLKNQVQAGDGSFVIKFTIPPQVLAAKSEDDEWTYYVAEKMTAYDSILGEKEVFGGLKIPKKKYDDDAVEYKPENALNPAESDTNFKLGVSLFGNVTAVTLQPYPKPIFEYTKVRAVDRPNFSQELIYNGRVGDNIKFLYRELSNSMMRAPFSQEVQYDLKEGNVIGFKGVRIKILSATNTQLEYVVLRSFPENKGR